MPDREIRVVVSLSGLQDASTAAQGFSADVKGVGDAAAEAATKTAPLADAVDKTAKFASGASEAWTQTIGILKQLGPSADGASAAFVKLANATGVRGLSVSIVQAQVAMDAFKQSVKDAEAAGTKMPPSVTAALRGMQGTIDASTQRLGTLRAGMSEVGTQAMAMGESWKQASSSGGSLNSMMFNLAETSGGATAAMAKAGLAGIGVFEAFKVGMKIGTDIDKILKDVGIDFSRLGEPVNFASNAVAGLSAQLAKTGIGGAAFLKWANDAKKAMDAYADSTDPVIFKVNKLMAVHEAAAKQLAADIEELKKLGVAWVDPISQAGKFASELKILDDAIHQNVLEGAKLSDIAESNAGSLAKVRHELDLKGLSLSAVSPKLAQVILLSEQWAKATEDAATKLETLRAKNDAMDKSLDTVDSGLRKQVNELERHIAAMEKDAAGGKKFTDAQEKIDPVLSKITETLRKEVEAAQKSGDVTGNLATAYDKASRAIVAYGIEAGRSDEEIGAMLRAQETLTKQMDDAATVGVPALTKALLAHDMTLQSVAKNTTSLAEQQRELNKAFSEMNAEADKQTAAIKVRNAAIDASTASTNAWGAAINGTTAGLLTNTAQAAAWGASLAGMSKITAQATIEMAFAKDGLSALDKEMKQAALDALADADAFGRVAGNLTEIKLAGDQAAAGLVGVDWAMRKATPTTVLLDDSQKALIESLAKVSDQYGQTSLWVGHLIAQFEAGSVSIDDFRKQLATMLLGMGALPAAFGNTAVEMNTLLGMIDKFKNTASNGWPVGTTTAPYSNPSNPLTGKP